MCAVSKSPFSLRNSFDLWLPDPAATDRLGKALARLLKPGMLMTLDGPLGSGKTALTRAVLAAWGFEGQVKSPSYALLEDYDFEGFSVSHFDFYRFQTHTEADDAGFREQFDGRRICIVEWPKQAEAWLPKADIEVQWLPASEGRCVRVTATDRVALQEDSFRNVEAQQW